MVNFVSHTVVIGFTAGAAILIATSQMKNILGIHIPKGESFLHTWIDIWNGVGNANVYILIVAVTTLLSALFIKHYYPKIPNILIGLIVGSHTALFLGSVEMILSW